MSQQRIELILLRQLATHLAMPIFIVDGAGNLIFYNEPAEQILGRRFEESGPMAASEWAKAWEPTDDAGKPLAPNEVPLSVALDETRPVHRRISIRGFDGVVRRIEAVAFPLIGTGELLGAAVMFWERK
jgi:PAS domain-containing protein